MAAVKLLEVLGKCMSVGSQSFVSAQSRVPRKADVAAVPTLKRAGSKGQPEGVVSLRGGTGVKKLPTYRKKPGWLRSLLVAQRGSNLVILLLVAVTLAAYSGTVCKQQLWTREYRKLEKLQRQERQMTATNEILKNQLAQQGENPDTGLVPPTAQNTIFMQPAHQLRAASPLRDRNTPEPAPNIPLGY